MKSRARVFRTSLLAALAYALAAPASLLAQSADEQDQTDAQSQDQRQDRTADRDDPQQRDRQDKQKKQQDDEQARGERADSVQYRLEPEGWISIAADYDRDGQYDAVETIYYYDLLMARDLSQRRQAENEQRLRPDFDQYDRDKSGRRRDDQRQRQVNLEGELVSKRIDSLIGHEDHQCVIGRVETSDGRTATVYLGKKQDVDKLDLQEGDNVRVEGTVSRMNDQPLVMAHHVSSGGESITNEQPPQQRLRKFTGRIYDLESTTFRGRDGEWMTAQIQTENEGWQQINLGKMSKLEKLDLQDGDKIQVLACEGRMDDESALIAQLVRANEQTADVREPTDRSLQKRDASNREDRLQDGRSERQRYDDNR